MVPEKIASSRNIAITHASPNDMLSRTAMRTNRHADCRASAPVCLVALFHSVPW